MPKNCKLFFLCLFLIISMSHSLFAATQKPLILVPSQETNFLGPYIELLEDKNGSLHIEDVSSDNYSAKFIPNKDKVLALPLSKSVYWLRFNLVEKTLPDFQSTTGDRVTQWLLKIGNSNLDEIDLYIPVDTTGEPSFMIKKTGAMRPRQNQDIPYRTFVLELPLNNTTANTFYMRIKSTSSLSSLMTVLTKDALFQHALLDYFLFGIIYGVLVSMVLYNLFIFLLLKDITYLYYVFYITSIFLYQLFLNGQALMAGNVLHDIQRQLLFLFVGFSIFWALCFARKFLATPKNTPILDKLLLLAIILSISIFIPSFLGHHRLSNQIAYYFGIIAPLLSITVGIRCYQKGFHPVKYYLIAWAFIISGSIIYVARGFCLLPPAFATNYSVLIGTALGSVLLSFGLADRIRTLRLEKKTLKESERRYQELSIKDELTGLYNSRYLFSKLTSEIEHAHRLERPLSIAMLDVDNFKIFNDTFGHPKGDKLLKTLSNVIMKSCRTNDRACRYGGEEFVVIFHSTISRDAHVVAERIRQSFEETKIHPHFRVIVSSTISIGIAQLQPDEDTKSIIKRADLAMYEAKSKGKNQSIVAS